MLFYFFYTKSTWIMMREIVCMFTLEILKLSYITCIISLSQKFQKINCFSRERFKKMISLFSNDCTAL